MVFKLAESAQKKWRRLNGHALIGDVIAGATFTDAVQSRAVWSEPSTGSDDIFFNRETY